MLSRYVLCALVTVLGLSACGTKSSTAEVTYVPVCNIKFDKAVTNLDSQSLMGKPVSVFNVSARATPMPPSGGESVGLILNLSPSDTNETVDEGDTVVMSVASPQNDEISGGDQIYLWLGYVSSSEKTAEGATVSSVEPLLKGTCTRDSTINVSSMTNDK